MKDKPAKVTMTEGTSEIYDHVEVKRNYVFIRHEMDGRTLHKYVPHHGIKKVTRIYDTTENGSENITEKRGYL